MFSSSLSRSVPLKTLAQQAGKAMLVVRNIQHLSGCVPADVCFILFDKIIAPILLYGSEIWGYEVRKDIEDVHVQCYYYVLGVARNTPKLCPLWLNGEDCLCQLCILHDVSSIGSVL